MPTIRITEDAKDELDYIKRKIKHMREKGEIDAQRFMVHKQGVTQGKIVEEALKHYNRKGLKELK